MAFRKLRLLNANDQIVAGIFVAIFLVVAILCFWQRSITNNGLIDFEDMPERHAVYLVDINRAPWPEFSNLPGIGEKLAKQIVDYRETNGPFLSTDQLVEISGIGQIKLDAMRPFIAVFDNVPSSVNQSQQFRKRMP